MEQGHRPVADTAGRRGARRLVAGGVAGTVMVGTALLGGGTASALDCSPLPLVGTALYQQCKALGTTAGGATSAAKAVPKAVTQAPAAVPKVVQAAPKVVPPATRPATGTASGAAGSLSGGTSAAATAPAASSSSAGSSGSAGPATAVPAAPALAPSATAPMSFTRAFDALPASFLATAAPGAFTSAFSLGTGVAGAYDPGLLLTSSAPLRSLAPSRVTSGSSAVPLSFLGEDGRIGTPVLLSVLSIAVIAALGVRAAVLRRARRRTA